MRKLSSLKFAAAALAASAAFGFTSPASAATATGELVVTATVLSSCVVIAVPMAFLTYSLGQKDATSVITVTCTPDISTYNVALGAGQGTGATTAVRKMKNLLGNETLNYSLYKDSGRSQIWGEAGAELQPSSASLDLGLIKTFTVYGRIPSNQSTGAIGAYADSVTVTVNY
ncbi:MAG: spore coat U domain-containing protein [Burkholderiaceae bacterium]